MTFEQQRQQQPSEQNHTKQQKVRDYIKQIYLQTETFDYIVLTMLQHE